MEWEKAKRLGADGLKLLAYYHPDAATAAEQEASMRGAARRDFLWGEALRRMRELSAIVQASARSWTAVYGERIPTVSEAWYRTY